MWKTKGKVLWGLWLSQTREQWCTFCYHWKQYYQGSHFFQLQGVFVRLTQLHLWRGGKYIFTVIKEWKGLHLHVCFRVFQSNSLSDIDKFDVASKGVDIDYFKQKCLKCRPGWGVCLKMQKALGGASKNSALTSLVPNSLEFRPWDRALLVISLWSTPHQLLCIATIELFIITINTMAREW